MVVVVGRSKSTCTPFIVYNTKLNVTFSITIESPAFYALQAAIPKNRILYMLYNLFDCIRHVIVDDVMALKIETI